MHFAAHKLTAVSITKAVLVSLAFSTQSLMWTAPSNAATPDSPEVRGMVDRGVRYLKKDHLYDEEHRALAAMALFKSGLPESDPFIQQALKECKDICRSKTTIDRVFSVYGNAVVLLFFCEVDAKQYEREIDLLMKSLQGRQKPFGGWGYPKPQPNWQTGDTSMTQYAVLSAWLSRSVGATELPVDAIRGVTNWLIRTQDPSGAWGYQGKDPGTGSSRRVNQTEIRHSLCVAGLGSLYICSSMLGYSSDTGMVTADEDIPPALQLVLSTPAGAGRTPDGQVNESYLKRAIRDGNRWYEANYRINPSQYETYYLYTLERYQSFKEAAEGKARKEPRWYNDGVRYLRSKQERDGKWDMPGGSGKLSDTAFAILFLVRSAQKTIAKSNDAYAGLLVAGQGLPNNTASIKLKEGRIVTTPFQGTANSMIEILSNQDHPDFDTVTDATKIELSDNPKIREQQQQRMRRLVRAESFRVRLVAVKTLGGVRDLNNVPALVYALSDPDVRVMMAARDGLRFTGRQFKGFGLEEDSSPEKRKEAIGAWKQWYLDIRPDAVFAEN